MREDELENRSLPYAAPHLNPSAMALDNAFDNPQSEARALLAFGANERIEHGITNFRRDAHPSVGHNDTDMAVSSARLGVPRFEDELSPIRHAVLRIYDQIRKQLPELVSGAFYRREVTHALVHGDARLGERTREQRQGVFDNAVKVKAPQVPRVTVESQHLPDNAGDALGLTSQSFVNGLRFGIQAGLKQIDGILDRLHGIVDLMSDGSCELAGSCEFLHLEHSALHLELLEFFPRRKVAQNSYRILHLSARILNLS